MQKSDVFIVHVWSGDAARPAFRAAVQRVGTDDSAWFTEALALARYLERSANAEHEAKNGAAPPESAREVK